VFEVRDYMFTRLDKQQRDFVGTETATTTLPAPAGADEMNDDEDAGPDAD